MKRFIHYVSHSVAAMIGISVYILADTFFIASYSGSDGLAVLNLVLPLYGLMLWAPCSESEAQQDTVSVRQGAKM